jgi:PAS domain S-box-containing protein
MSLLPPETGNAATKAMSTSKHPALSVDITSPDSTKATLQFVALLIAASGSAMALYMYFYSVTPRNFIAPGILGLLGWSTLAVLRMGYIRYVAHVVVAGVLLAAVVSIVAFGSLRSPGVMLFVAAVVAAGIFLGRVELVLSVAFTICSLSALLWAEQQGLLLSPSMKVDLRTLVSYLTITVVVAIMVYYARERTRRAHQQLVAELEARRLAEQERDRNLDRLTRIFRSSPSPMIAQSANTGVILDVNPAFERCYGHLKDSVLGKTDAFLWAEPSEREAYVRRLANERAVHQVEVAGLRADGSRFSALVSSETGRDSQDHLVITSVTDLTAHAEALEKLRRSEERFAKAFNFSPLKMTITRLSDGTFVEVNQARDPVQGHRRNELLGKTTLETGGWLSPQERQAFLERIQRDGHVSGFDTRMRHANGEVIDARMWAELIEIDGEDCVLSCFVNTTEEKRREALLLSVARGMSGETGEAFFTALTRHAALTLKADLVVVGELAGDGSIETLAAWKDGVALPHFSYDPSKTPCGDTLQGSDLRYLERGLDAAYPQVALLTGVRGEAHIGQRLHDQDGTVTGVLQALWRQPITLNAEMTALMSIFSSRAAAELMRLRREREIQQLNATLEQRVQSRTAELQKLNAELDSFAYSVSHDLKSPLRAIDGFTRLLGEQLDGRLSADEAQLFDRVLVSTRRMSTLIADLLALARVSQGQLEMEPTDLSKLAEQVLRAEQSRQPDAPLRWHVEPGIVHRCDPKLMRIALENLLGNAVKYSRHQPDPLVEMGRVPAAHGDPTLLFVRDNGVGFNMAYADKLFKPFQRLHAPTEFEGTGIGLAERHGGRIEGCSQPGQGAEFRFSLGPAPLSP